MSKKDNEKQSAKKVKEKFNQILELPKELLLDLPRITLLGSEQVLVENYKGITEYEQNLIRLNNCINIYGKKLNVEEITVDDILITGRITSIEFENEK
jgi:sporulation protein YqfC